MLALSYTDSHEAHGAARMPRNRLWTAMDEEVPFSFWIALPGHDHLGLGQHWHFFNVTAWIITGLIYLLLLVVTPQWQRLIPTFWAIFPQAWHTAMIYASLHLPPEGHPFNPLQLCGAGCYPAA